MNNPKEFPYDGCIKGNVSENYTLQVKSNVQDVEEKFDQGTSPHEDEMCIESIGSVPNEDTLLISSCEDSVVSKKKSIVNLFKEVLKDDSNVLFSFLSFVVHSFC